jgi:hypothetical protein
MAKPPLFKWTIYRKRGAALGIVEAPIEKARPCRSGRRFSIGDLDQQKRLMAEDKAISNADRWPDDLPMTLFDSCMVCTVRNHRRRCPAVLDRAGAGLPVEGRLASARGTRSRLPT